MHRSMFYVFKYLDLALYVCMFMFMGARWPDDLVFSSVLLPGRRVGDVTFLYQNVHGMAPILVFLTT